MKSHLTADERFIMPNQFLGRRFIPRSNSPYKVGKWDCFRHALPPDPGTGYLLYQATGLNAKRFPQEMYRIFCSTTDRPNPHSSRLFTEKFDFFFIGCALCLETAIRRNEAALFSEVPVCKIEEPRFQPFPENYDFDVLFFMHLGI
jgi:hypothetical protein